MLHLIHEHAPKIPVVFIDTGFLFPETYQYAEELTSKFDLGYPDLSTNGFRRADAGVVGESVGKRPGRS